MSPDYRLIWPHPWKILGLNPNDQIIEVNVTFFPANLKHNFPIYEHFHKISLLNLAMLIVRFWVNFGVNLKTELSLILRISQLYVFIRNNFWPLLLFSPF